MVVTHVPTEDISEEMTLAENLPDELWYSA